MSEKQKTLGKEVSLSGIGLHTGRQVNLTMKPAKENTGFVFVRTDLEGNPQVEADVNYVTTTERGTTLEKLGVKIHTCEHLLAALVGMDIDNAILEMNSAEPPIMDGSSKFFVEAIEEAGVVEQDKKYHKSYLAIVEGQIKEEMEIDKGLDREGLAIGVRMKVCDEGKQSVTVIKPISYNKEKDLTLIEALPLTGRQHQIRVHLYSENHRILGDPIYGVDDVNAEDYLNKTLSDEARFDVTKSHRLWLHANYLEFTYKDVTYKVFSKNKDLYNEFLN